MKEQGIATKIDGQAVTVRLGASPGCASCVSQHECSVAGKELVCEAAPGYEIAVGDAVELEVPGSAGVVGALWLLGLPLGLFFAGYSGAGVLWPGRGEGIQALVGLGGVALGLLFAATVARKGRMSRKPRVTPLVGAES